LQARRADIEAAKGLAILLVVFGHLVARQDPAGVSWYEPLRRAVYAFHMPLFLYLSGLVAAYSGFLHHPRAALRTLAAARARRLLVPFFGLGAMIVLGKLTAEHLMFVDNAPKGMLAGLLALVWDTGNSPALSIWYLFVLFIVSLGSVWLLDRRVERLPWLLAMSLILFWLPFPAILYLDRVAMFAPFFMVGAICGMAGGGWNRCVDRYWPWAMLVFAGGLVTAAMANPAASLAQKSILLTVGTVSMPALHGCLRNLELPWLQNLFLRLGRYCFMIYLFNTLCIGLAKALLLHFSSWNGSHFDAFAPLLMTAGLVGPIALKRFAFRRVTWLDRMTD
jgi:fucose 4-O-acetylase-like acetyltransferase